MKDDQKWDPELCRFIELFYEHTEKPLSKVLAGESADVEIIPLLLE